MIFYILGIVIIIIASGLRVVKQYERGVIFLLGKCTGVRGPGLIFVVPIFEQMTKVTMRTVTMAIPSQKIITKDNVSIDIAITIIFKLSIYSQHSIKLHSSFIYQQS